MHRCDTGTLRTICGFPDYKYYKQSKLHSSQKRFLENFWAMIPNQETP